MIEEKAEISRAKKRIATVGPLFGFVAPALYVIVAYLVIHNRISPPDTSPSQLHMLFYLLLILSFTQIAITVFVRNRLPAFIINYATGSKSQGLQRLFGSGKDAEPAGFSKTAFNISIIMFALVESCSIYGLLLVLLGLEFDYIWLLIALTVTGYLLVRPDEDFLKLLHRKIRGRGANP
jgi:hypothetical protein